MSMWDTAMDFSFKWYNLPHKVKTQYLHSRSQTCTFLCLGIFRKWLTLNGRIYYALYLYVGLSVGVFESDSVQYRMDTGITNAGMSPYITSRKNDNYANNVYALACERCNPSRRRLKIHDKVSTVLHLWTRNVYMVTINGNHYLPRDLTSRPLWTYVRLTIHVYLVIIAGRNDTRSKFHYESRE